MCEQSHKGHASIARSVNTVPTLLSKPLAPRFLQRAFPVHSDGNGVVRELTYIETTIDVVRTFHERVSFPSLRPQLDT